MQNVLHGVQKDSPPPVVATCIVSPVSQESTVGFAQSRLLTDKSSDSVLLEERKNPVPVPIGDS